MSSSSIIPWRKLVPQGSSRLSHNEYFYSKKENIDSLRLIDVSMVSHYFTKGDIEGCKKTMREFWDNVEKSVISPLQCALIDKKCFALLKAIIDTFKQSAQSLSKKYAIVDVKKMQDQLDYIRASVTGVLHFEMDDIDLSLLDYFVLRCHILGLVFINQILRLHVKMTIGEVEGEMFKKSTGEHSAWTGWHDNLPSLPSLKESLLTSSLVESLIENQWKLQPESAKNFTLQYPAIYGKSLSEMEEHLKKSAAAWEKFNGSRGG